MRDFSHIIVQVNIVEGIRPIETYSYEWEDPEKRIALLPRRYEDYPEDYPTEIGSKFTLGSLRLQVLEVDAISDSLIVQLVSRGSSLRYFKHQLRNKWSVFKHRIFWTFVVWGLKDRPDY